ncbi:MAG: hypothetical protein ACTSX6_09985 [Candidatus Heimdallarchaeaceae archaeon]
MICEKCVHFKKKIYCHNEEKYYVACNFDNRVHDPSQYCENFEFRKEWHPELYVIYKKCNESKSGLSRQYRIRVKQQIAYVSAGGTSVSRFIPYSQHRLVRKGRREYIQVTDWYYQKHKQFFDMYLTFEDEQQLLRREKKVAALDTFIQGGYE